MFWSILSNLYPARASWACWFRWTYNLRLWIAGKAYGWEMRNEYRSRGYRW